MRRKLFLLLAAVLAVTGIGWAQDITSTISTDLVTAKVNKEIVFGVTSTQGNIADQTMVKVRISLNDASKEKLKNWELKYYETQSEPEAWMKWDESSKGYLFGPEVGFELKDATSYFSVKPTEDGEFSFVLEIVKVGDNNEVLKSKSFKINIANDAKTIENKDVCYASLYTAVRFAKAGETIILPSGTFDLKPGMEEYQDPEIANDKSSGWYLPIQTSNITIKGAGSQGEGKTVLKSTVKSTNDHGNNNVQNFITIFGDADNVKLQDMEIICKSEANKVIQVFAKNFSLENVVFNAPERENFAGSLYFMPKEGDVGTVNIKKATLNQGRLSFSGATKGTVNLTNVTINYADVAIAEDVISNYGLQAYPPIGNIVSKPELNITATDLAVNLAAKDGFYKADINTFKNLPAKAIVSLADGNYELSESLLINKAMTIKGSTNTVIQPAEEFTAKKYLIDIQYVSASTDSVKLENLIIDGGAAVAEHKGGITIWDSKVYLKNITAMNNPATGITVAAKSVVKASGINTSGNGWGGINIGLGSVKEGTISFTLEKSENKLVETLPIYVDESDTTYIGKNANPKITIEVPDDFIRLVGSKGEAVWNMKKQEATSDNLDDLINQQVPEIVLKPEEGKTEIVIDKPLAIPEKAEITIKSDDAEKPITIVAPTGKPAITIPNGATFTLENVVIESKTVGQAAIQINKTTSTGGTLTPTPVSLSGTKFVGDAIAVEKGVIGVKITVDSCNFNPISIPSTASSSILRTEDQVINEVISVGDNETTINRCTFKGIQKEGAIISGTNIVVTNSLFADNKDMQLMDLSLLTKVTKIQLINNTFINPTSAGKDIIAFPGNTTNKDNVQKNVIIANNILWTKAFQSISGKLDGASIINNALRNTDIALATGNLTNIIFSSIPTFKGNGDYHLPNSSPLVAKGATTTDIKTIVGEKDIEGEARLTGGKINLGAYEKTYTVTNPDDPGLAPTVEAPKVADRKDTSAKVEWVKVTNATTYQLRVYTGSDKSTMVGNVYEVANPTTSVSFAVTGLEKGKAYYGVASAYKGDGTIIVRKEFDITKSNTVGIEEIFAGSRVYTSGKNLCIEPSQDVKVTVIGMDGKMLFNETISQRVIVPIANSGIYAVTFTDGKSQATQKVAVF